MCYSALWLKTSSLVIWKRLIDKRTVKIKWQNPWFSQGVKRKISCGNKDELQISCWWARIYFNWHVFHKSFLYLGTICHLHEHCHTCFESCRFTLLVSKPWWLPAQKWGTVTMPSHRCSTTPGVPAGLCWRPKGERRLNLISAVWYWYGCTKGWKRCLVSTMASAPFYLLPVLLSSHTLCSHPATTYCSKWDRYGKIFKYLELP